MTAQPRTNKARIHMAETRLTEALRAYRDEGGDYAGAKRCLTAVFSGHSNCEPHNGSAQPEDNGQTRAANHSSTAKPREDQPRDATQQLVVQGPTQADRKAMVKVRKNLSVLDTFTITERQGSTISIGDVPAHAWKRIAAQKSKKTWVAARETELALILADHIGKQAHVPNDAATRDIIDAAFAEQAIGKSAEIADYQTKITSIVTEAVNA